MTSRADIRYARRLRTAKHIAFTVEAFAGLIADWRRARMNRWWIEREREAA